VHGPFVSVTLVRIDAESVLNPPRKEVRVYSDEHGMVARFQIRIPVPFDELLDLVLIPDVGQSAGDRGGDVVVLVGQVRVGLFTVLSEYLLTGLLIRDGSLRESDRAVPRPTQLDAKEFPDLLAGMRYRDRPRPRLVECVEDQRQLVTSQDHASSSAKSISSIPVRGISG